MTPADSPDAPNHVLVTGATGFIGTNTCRTLVRNGFHVLGLVRRLPDEADRLPGITYLTGDITDPASLSPTHFASIGAVVHLVGIIVEEHAKGQTFERIHVEGTRNLLTALERHTERKEIRFVYISALGAAPDSPSAYARTKAQAEALVEASPFPSVILRPSVVLGPNAEFLKQMEGLIRRPPLTPFPLPFVPVPGNGENQFQPIYIDDLTACILHALRGDFTENDTAIFEVGGADTITLNALLKALEQRMDQTKPLLHAPMPLMYAAAALLEGILPRPPLTTDQIENLKRDNICDIGPMRTVLGVDPLGFDESLTRSYSNKSPAE